MCPAALGSEPWFPLVPLPYLSLAASAPATGHRIMEGRDFLLQKSHYPLENGMAIHSNTLAWRIPRTGEPGGLKSMGSQRVGHD